METRQIEVKIIEKKGDRRYDHDNYLFVGKILVCTYGFNYGRKKDEKKNYSISSKLVQISPDFIEHSTEEDAKKIAYRVVEIFIKNLGIEPK